MKLDTAITSCAAITGKLTDAQQKDIVALGIILNNWKLGSSFGKSLPLIWEELAMAYEKARV